MSLSTTLKTVLQLSLAAGLLFSAPLWGQEFRATITGAVTDNSGAAVPRADIEVRNIDTAAVTTAKSNDTGVYTVPFVLPGIYAVKASATGFKQAVNDHVEVHAGDKVQVDLKLEVGAITESVSVTAEAELLRTATASMGQTINTTETRDLPVMGRNTYMLADLATGMYTALSTTSQASGFGRPYDGASAQMSSEGIGSQYQIMLNGIPNAPEERASAAIYVGFVPSPDSVEEVTVQTHMYDAQYGHSSGTVVNAVLKGGTNTLHGSLYEFFRNDKLNANSFAGNAARNPRGVMRWNQPGFVIDGPVRIPKIYNGKDKTFFMFNMEWIRNASPLPYTASYPTAAERTGDFSGLVNATGAPVIIYDPLSTVLNNGQYLRTPFTGNIIPKNFINPIGQALINAYPLPNLPGTLGGFNNYVVSPNSQQDKYHSLSSRVDHQINEKNRLTVMGFSNVRHQLFPDYGWSDPGASPGYLHFRNNHGGSVDWTDTLSPNTVLDIKYGVIFHPFQVGLYGDNYDISKLGFSQQFISQMPHVNYPGLGISGGYTGTIGNAGTGTPGTSQYTTTLDHSLSGTLNKTIGKHSLKMGGELYVMKANNNTPVSNLNSFSFSAGFTQQNVLTGSATAGNPFASLLLGWPSGGGYSVTIASAFQQIYTGFFVQDDWRVTPNLTLNLGLRWEYESPMSERYNRQNDGFDVNATNPLQSQVSGLTLKGGLLFTDSNHRLPFKRDLNNFGPRIGASYRLGKNTVLRGGFGTNYSVTFQTGGNTGFSANTGYVSSNDTGLTPANGLSSPFPGGILPATGSSLGLATQLGQGFSFADPNRTIPKIYNYSLAIQHQLPGQTLVELAFAGNDASQLSVSKGINFLPRSFYVLPGGTPPVPSTTLVAQVPNPMAGKIPGSSLNNATIAYQSLQIPFPEFGGITESTRPLGNSLYNSLQVSVEKRLSGGLQGRVSYTWNKIMQATGYLNDQDDWSQLARGQAGEPTKVLTVSLTYMLPIFAGKGILHNALGGWEANAIVRYLNGSLVGAPGGVFSTGINPQVDNPTYQHWFNTCTVNTSGARQNCVDANQPVAFIQTPPYTLRTISGNLPGIRTEVPTTMDFSLFKTFQFHEKAKLQLRANAYNLANTPIFGGPNTTTGVIGIGQVNDPRIVELALKLNF